MEIADRSWKVFNAVLNNKNFPSFNSNFPTPFFPISFRTFKLGIVILYNLYIDAVDFKNCTFLFSYFLTSEYDIECKRNAPFQNLKLWKLIEMFDLNFLDRSIRRFDIPCILFVPECNGDIDVGDDICWWQVFIVGDRFSPCGQISDAYILSPTSKMATMIISSTLRCHQHHSSAFSFIDNMKELSRWFEN